MKKMKIINWMFCCIVIVIICLCYVLGRSEYTSWHLNYMNIDGLWEYSKGENQVIAFIDTGI